MASPGKTPLERDGMAEAQIEIAELEAEVVRLQQERDDLHRQLEEHGKVAGLAVDAYEDREARLREALRIADDVIEDLRSGSYANRLKEWDEAALVASPDKPPERKAEHELPTPDDVLGILPRAVGGEQE